MNVFSRAGKKFNSVRLSLAASTYESEKTKQALYEIVADEVNREDWVKGIYAKAFSDAEGNEEKARALYMRYRVKDIARDAKMVQLVADEYTQRRSKKTKQQKKTTSTSGRNAYEIPQKMNQFGYKTIYENGEYVITDLNHKEHTVKSTDALEKKYQALREEEATGMSYKSSAPSALTLIMTIASALLLFFLLWGR